MLKLKRTLILFLLICCFLGLGAFTTDSAMMLMASAEQSFSSDPPDDEDNNTVISANGACLTHYSQTIDMFWEYLAKQMLRTEEGETVTAVAEWRTSMPAYMFETIKDSGVNLLIRWDGGEDIHINAENVPEIDEKIVSFYFDEIIEMLGDNNN